MALHSIKMLSMESEPVEDHCPHCGGPLYPSREEKQRRDNFYTQLAAIVFIVGAMTLGVASHIWW